MLNKLKKHWQVETNELILILCTFAVTGTTTAWLSKKVAEWLLLDKYGIAWWTSKIVVLIFGYQVIILIVGFCFGMFSFFWKYEKKILARLGFFRKELALKIEAEPLVVTHHLKSSHHPEEKNEPSQVIDKDYKKAKFRLAIFASGAGSNAQKIINYFRTNNEIEIALIVCNKLKAGVLTIAETEAIPILIIDKTKFSQSGYVEELQRKQIDLIVLAGFLWQIPPVLIQTFHERIINIHPALLPAYGGKGMYGNAVHQAIINAKEKESGITIHFVDELYDHGKIIFQATCDLNDNETVETLANKVHLLEHEHFPKQIAKVVSSLHSKE